MNLRISLPIQLIGVIFFVLLFGGLFGHFTISLLYTFSMLFKDILNFLLPFIVFSFVLTGILAFKKSAPIILLILLITIFCSNGLVALVSYGVMKSFFSISICAIQTEVMSFKTSIEPLYIFPFKPFVRSEYALLSAIFLGLFFSFFPWFAFEKAMNTFKNLLEKVLNFIVIPFLPLYVLGFLLKIRHEGIFAELIKHYGGTAALIIVIQICYLILMYFVVNSFSIKKMVQTMSNALPTYLTAFSTMSSTATVPVSIIAAYKNTGNRPLANMAMPIMANVHLLGDSISTPILALTTLILYKGCLPGIEQYLSFVFYFCTTMFAVSGIPGGGILVMIPILISQLGFTPDMISIITALYVLLDSFGTAANVMGDGALVILVNTLLKRLQLVD